MPTTIVMPKLGMTMKEGTVIEWLKRPGDIVKEGEGVVTISSEKLTSEVEAPASGILLEIVEKEDSEVEVGKVIGVIGKKDEDAQEETVSTSSATTVASVTTTEKPEAVQQQQQVKNNRQIRISPAARKKAKELGVDTIQVTGTGPKGRITRADIEQFAKGQEEKAIVHIEQEEAGRSNIDPSIENMPRIRSVISKRMHESLQSTAQLTLHRKANINKLIEFQAQIKREAKSGNAELKLTLTVLVARAVLLSLQDKPFMNTHLINNKLHEYKEVHLGIATAVQDGLVVPVVRNAAQLSLGNLAKSISLVAEKARRGNAGASELTGSTFTITNLGSQGIEYFTPILNTPESGILGVGTLMDELILEDGNVKNAKKLPLSLTFDHRILDGAPAAEFLGQVIYYLEHPYLLVL